MRNVAPTWALTQRSRSWMIFAGLTGLLGLLGLVISIALFIVPLSVPDNPGYPLYTTVRNVSGGLGAVLIVAAVAMAVRAITWRTDNPLATQVGDLLAGLLDERYIYIRNVSKLAIGYIDALLLGPQGILVFRITEKEGVLNNQGARWITQVNNGEWKTTRWSPTREVLDDISSLESYLADRGIRDIPISGLIVFIPDPPATRISGEPLVPYCHFSQLSSYLQTHYLPRQTLPLSEVNRVLKALYD